MDLRKSLRRTLPLAALALVAVLGVAGGRAARAATAADTPIAITMTDATITAPAQLPAGFNSFTVTNSGTMPHDFNFFKFNPGVTLAQAAAAAANIDENDPAGFLALEDYGKFYGGTSVDPGASVTIGFNLPAGSYGLADPNNFASIPPVAVTVSGTGGAAPAADMTVRQREFAFDAPATVKAGSTRIAVQNAGSQVHEMVLVKLDPGKTLDDLKAAASDPNLQGPPDWVHPASNWDPQSSKVGGMITVDLTPGTYGLLCFMPDTATLTPHAVLGMANTFTVQ